MQPDSQHLYRGFSLHIGLNKVDPASYGGWAGELSCCENDAIAMYRLAESQGYLPLALLTEGAQIDRVKNAIAEIRDEILPAEYFLLTYSSHTGQVPDENGDDPDHLDEAICLYDGLLLDDLLFSWLKEFPERCRITVVADSCHSAGAIRTWGRRIKAMPRSVVQPAYRTQKDYYDSLPRLGREKYDLGCFVAWLSACQENQYAGESNEYGLFTEMLLRVWQDGAFSGDYYDFIKRIGALMPEDQSPGLELMGPRDLEWFGWSTPFKLR